jgi:3-oxoacyl-[acyl-carrier-protein] synthase II
MEPAVNGAVGIVGLGLLTPFGTSARATWESLLAGKSIADHARVAGFAGPRRVIDLAIQAAREAIGDARWGAAESRSDDCGLFVGTSKGTIESWMQEKSSSAHHAPLAAWGLSEIDRELALALGFAAGPRMTISAACSSGLHALIRAAMAIAGGEIRRALVVGVEASVHPLFVSSFRRLGVLAPEGYGCRPFDQERRGFFISEAAAAICLERCDESSRPISRIDQWAIAGDGAHLTRGDVEGKSLRKMLSRVMASGCDLVHAHATGTIVNDPVELAAIESAAIESATGDCRPWLYSHKGAVGHSLGASGMVSAVLNCLAHRDSRVPGNVHSTRPIPMTALRFSTTSVQTPLKRSIVLAAGFGGPLAAVSLAT